MNYSRREGYTNLDNEGKSYKCTTKIVLGVTFLAVITISLISVVPVQVSSKSKSSGPGNGQILSAVDNGPQVEIDMGILLGKIMQTRGGRDYFVFHNIPYAKPSIGELRFEPPQEYTEKWTGVRDATVRGEKCIQIRKNMTEIQGSEDCHYLNVFTPKLPEGGRQQRSKLFPVMFYMFGGGFKGGQGSNYGGDYMLDKDVVIVLPEYRHGAMGFLSTGDSVISGNMGFKDQVMALRWVQKNIQKFNGDPNRVTIFGNSAGAAAVHAHMLSNMSRGLFHRGISQSGVFLTSPNGTFVPNPRERIISIGRSVGCPDLQDSKALAKCLKEADAGSVLSAQGTQLFSLVVEATLEDGDLSNIFMTDTPLNLMVQGKMNPDVTWIVGVNDGEMDRNAVVFDDPVKVKFYNNSWEIAAPIDLDYADDENHTMSKKIRQFYFSDKDIGPETRFNFSDALNDRSMIHPSIASANLQASFQNTSPVYLYWMSKLPLVSVGDSLKESFDPPYRVSHSDEVQYLFLYLNGKNPYIGKDSPDYNQSLLIVDIWTEFADTGKPSSIWTPVPKGNQGNGDKVWFHLDVDTEVTMFNPEGLKERMEFWDSFPLNRLYVQNVAHYDGKVK